MSLDGPGEVSRGHSSRATGEGPNSVIKEQDWVHAMGVEQQQGSGKQLDLFDEVLTASLCHGASGKGGTGAGTIESGKHPRHGL